MSNPEPSETLDSLLAALAQSVAYQDELGGEVGVSRHQLAQLLTQDPEPEQLPQQEPAAPAPPAAAVVATVMPGVGPPTAPTLTLEAVRTELGDCTRCGLHKGRQNIVFGAGNPTADLMFIGEAPGANEDREGEPFVGRAGHLLTKMIGAMGLARADVYIANVIKCRPPENRDPEMEEVESCEPFLLKQIDVIKPKVIVTLGRVSASALLRRRVAITRERGRWLQYHGTKLMPTLHPAYLLRNPAAKRDAWADLQAVMAELGLERPKRA